MTPAPVPLSKNASSNSRTGGDLACARRSVSGGDKNRSASAEYFRQAASVASLEFSQIARKILDAEPRHIIVIK
jgi:hypothetical protein